MDDQKRVILIVIVVVGVLFGIFLIAELQFNPKEDRTPVVQYVQDPKNQLSALVSPSPSPVGSPAPSTSGINNNQNQEVVIVYGNNPTYNADGSHRVQIGPTASGAPNAVGPTTIVMTPAPLATSQPAKVISSHQPTETKKPITAVKKPSSKEYWIQVVASASRDTVELVKKDLANKGWNGRVSLTKLNNADWYRLRYGPFENSGEANKFLDWVKQSPGLSGSFLTQETPGK
jgi:cell division septation protein DedD